MLSVPLTIIVKVALEQTTDRQSIAILLSDLNKRQNNYKSGLQKGRRIFKSLKRFQNRIHTGFGIAKQHLRIFFKEQRVLHTSITGIH